MAFPPDRPVSGCLDNPNGPKPMQYVTTLSAIIAGVSVALPALVAGFPLLPGIVMTGLFIFNLSVYVVLESTNVR